MDKATKREYLRCGAIAVREHIEHRKMVSCKVERVSDNRVLSDWTRLSEHWRCDACGTICVWEHYPAPIKVKPRKNHALRRGTVPVSAKNVPL